MSVERRTHIGLDPRLLLGGTDDEILRCYLELVREWRGAAHGQRQRLRHADVAVLVSILGTDGVEVERRLIAATACTNTTARLARRLLLASVGGALAIGLTATTIGGETPARAETPPVAPLTTSEPSAPPSAPAPIAALPPGAEATVSIPSLDIDLPIVSGGQAVIDRGVVAHYFAAGWKDAVAAGTPGTYWLAAHHLTHGGPFSNLVNITVGTEIRITTDSNTFVYTVTSTAIVGLLPGDVAIYGVDESAPVILLQTCIDDTRRFLVHGSLTTTH